jgi:hypothetical protein
MDPQIKRIPQLLGATGLTPEDLLVVNQVIGGENKTRKLPLEQLQSYIEDVFDIQGATGSTGPQGATGAQGATGPAGQITVAPNSGLAISGGQLTTIYNTLIGDSVDNVPTGGAGATGAITWKNKSLVETLDAILFPDLLPSYSAPTIELTASQSGVREVGTYLNQTLTLTGIKNDAGAFSSLTITKNGSTLHTSSSPTIQPAPEVNNEFGIVNDNNPNYRYIISYTDNSIASVGVCTWGGYGSYAAGLNKKNNKGITDTRSALIRSSNAPQAAATGFNSNSVTLNVIYPYFYGVSSSQPSPSNIASIIQSGDAYKILESSIENVTVTFNADSEYIWLAVPSIYPLKTKWQNTEFNKGNIGAGQFILLPIEYTVDSPDSYWTGESYQIYISASATRTENSITFKN